MNGYNKQLKSLEKQQKEWEEKMREEKTRE
jgi:hypothetical protein